MNEKKIILSPSLLSCDFAAAGRQLAELEAAGIGYIHLDVMDGVFVNNISFGIPVIKSLRAATKLKFDTHLMITQPERYIERFAEAGSDIITFHAEATDNPMRAIEMIHSAGVPAGISVKPGTPAESVAKYIPFVDLILVMTVEPGFGGQKFMPEMMPKLEYFRERIDASGRSVLLSVDGGIDLATARTAVASGADMLVAGSAVFRKPDIGEAVKAILASV